MDERATFRGFRYRLYPTSEQECILLRWMGVCRFIFNTALWQRENQWRQYHANTGKHMGILSQSRELTDVRREIDWVSEVPRVMLEYALRDLDLAFRNFFSGKDGHPKYRGKGERDSLHFKGREARVTKLNAKWTTISVPKLGLIKFRDTRDRIGALRKITISRHGGRWFVSILCESVCRMTMTALPSVGIDRGVANTLVLSTGEKLSVPGSLEVLERRQRRARRILSRRKRGSTRYAKQRRRVANLSAKCSCIRRDWHHRVTTDIARRFGFVTVEALKVKSMTAAGSRKHGLNRAILNQGWSIFTELLAYKLDERGGSLLTVNPAYTSQTCSECGTIDITSRESQAVFRCSHCGFEGHADHNAAINILRRSTPVSLAEVARWGADETRTTNQALVA